MKLFDFLLLYFRCVIGAMSSSAEMMKLFLASVQGNDKFVQKAFDVLAKNDINELAEMKCAKVNTIKEHVGAMSGGLEGF